MNKPPKASVPKTKNPSIGNQPSSKQVPRPKVPTDRKWFFSFRCWNQVDYFGLDAENVSLNWFISFLEKLKSLSDKTIEQVMFNPDERRVHRFHEINWMQRNIPISKEDLYWVPADILDSEEFPFYQFQISQALGRIIGYFDVDYVFHIVLLDPKHNAQPSQYDNYQVQETRILLNEYQILKKEIASIHQTAQTNCDENCKVLLHASQSIWIDEYVFVDGNFKESVEELSKNYNYDDLQDLLLDAFIALEEKKKAQRD